MLRQGNYSKIGELIIIELEPIQYVLYIDSFTDIVENQTSNRYFDKYFQYSIDDGFTFSDWILLNDTNLQLLVLNPIKNLLINLSYKRAGTDETGSLDLISVTLNFVRLTDIVDTLYPAIFSNDNQIFGYIKVNDVNTHVLFMNLLYKSYKSILPKFINRSQATYYFTKAICWYLSLYFTHSQNYVNFYNDKWLLLDFLKSKGLYFSDNETLEELQVICSNLFNEFDKRGTFNVNEEIRRLLGLNKNAPILTNSAGGWFLNKTSPIYRSLESVSTLNQMLDKDGTVTKLSNYYIYGNVSIINDIDNYGNAIRVINITNSRNTGIKQPYLDPTSILNIPIFPKYDYEVSFKIKQEIAIDKLKFGVSCFSADGVLLDSIRLSDLSVSNEFIDSTSNLILNPEDKFVKVKGILFTNNEAQRTDNLNIGIGSYLKMPLNTAFIYPIIYSNNDVSSLCDVRIYDIRVAVLNYKPFHSFLELSNYLLILLQNFNKNLTVTQINEIINRYLVPANSTIDLNIYE